MRKFAAAGFCASLLVSAAQASVSRVSSLEIPLSEAPAAPGIAPSYSASNRDIALLRDLLERTQSFDQPSIELPQPAAAQEAPSNIPVFLERLAEIKTPPPNERRRGNKSASDLRAEQLEKLPAPEVVGRIEKLLAPLASRLPELSAGELRQVGAQIIEEVLRKTPSPQENPSLVDVALSDRQSNALAQQRNGYAQLFKALPVDGRTAEAVARTLQKVSPFSIDINRIDAQMYQEGLARPEQRRYFLAALAEKLHMPIKPMRHLLKTGGEHIAHSGLRNHLEFLHGLRENVLPKAISRRLTQDELWEICDALLSLGLGPDDISGKIQQILPPLRSAMNKTFPEIKQAFLKSIEWVLRTEMERSVVSLNGDWFDGRPGARFKPDLSVVPEVLLARDRTRKSGHTLDVNGYIARHMSPALMNHLADHPEVKIRLYTDELGHVLRELHAQGFVEAVRLSNNSFTDYIKILARNPSTNETILAMVAPAGKAYLREMAATVVYYTAPSGHSIAPSRIQAFSAPESRAPEASFRALLKAQNIDPDVVSIGYTKELGRELDTHGIKPSRTIHLPNMKAGIFEINGLQVASFAIEPFLFSDRAGELATAVLGLSDKKRVILFMGSGGALDPAVRRGDIVIPNTVSAADALRSIPLPGFSNEAAEVARAMGLEGAPGVHLDRGHGSVSTILYEDQKWYRTQSERIAIVEQEVFSIARAVQSSPRRQNTRTYVILDVSDELHSDNNFLAKDIRQDSATQLRPAQIAWRILQDLGDVRAAKPALPVQLAPRPPPQPRPISIKAWRMNRQLVLNISGRPRAVNMPEGFPDLDPRADESFNMGLKRLSEESFLREEDFLKRLSDYLEFFHAQYGYRITTAPAR